MLYMFDIDGTLIRSFLREGGAPCPKCDGEGILYNERDSTDEAPYVCWRCNGSKKVKDSTAFDLVEVLPGRAARILKLVDEPGSRFALVTNQGGVAFGYQTAEQVHRKMGAVVAEFGGFNGRPLSLHVCFAHPKGTVPEFAFESERRKPGPGMLIEALDAHGAVRTDERGVAQWNAVFVGDMDTDEQAARAAGVRYVDAEAFFA